MISILPRKFMVGFVLTFFILLLYYLFFRGLHKGGGFVNPPPILLQDFVNDGVTSFSRLRYNKEDDVFPYEAFTRENLYTDKRHYYFDVALPWTRVEEDNRDDVISMALQQTKDVTGGALLPRHFQYGLRRVLPGIGEEYTLVFHSGDDVFEANLFRKLEGPLVTMTRHPLLHQHPVHIILPLSGRLDRLHEFLTMLEHLLDEGQNIQLTVAAFSDGVNGTEAVRRTLAGWRYAERARLTALTGAFSRGMALMRGAAAAAAADGGDPLLFFCDVDVEFTATELEKCRLHAQRAGAVYYPVVFSRYNWRLAAALEGVSDWQAARRRSIGADTGHWRVYGFGMSCQYHSDFAAVSGAYLDKQGWGGEDIALYRRFIERYRVVRAFDPDIQHTYHPKHCDRTLTEDQYRGCVFSKIKNEGTQLQLGMLALGKSGELDARGYRLLVTNWWHTPAGLVALSLGALLLMSAMLNVFCYLRLQRRQV